MKTVGNFAQAARGLNSNDRIVDTWFKGVKKGKEGAINSGHTNKATMKSFRQALQAQYGKEIFVKIDQNKSLKQKLQVDGNNQLTAGKIKDAIKFCNKNAAPRGKRDRNLSAKRQDMAEAAKASLRIFKEQRHTFDQNDNLIPGQVGIRSNNNAAKPSDFLDSKTTNKLREMRNNQLGYLEEDAKAAVNAGVGNCGEKAMITGVSLKSNPLLEGYNVYVVEAKDYDHSYCIVTDQTLKEDGTEIDISTLGKNTMVVDGWTQDFYFPNQTNYRQREANNGVPNIRQNIVRRKVKNHKFTIRNIQQSLISKPVPETSLTGPKQYFQKLNTPLTNVQAQFDPDSNHLLHYTAVAGNKEVRIKPPERDLSDDLCKEIAGTHENIGKRAVDWWTGNSYSISIRDEETEQWNEQVYYDITANLAGGLMEGNQDLHLFGPEDNLSVLKE